MRSTWLTTCGVLLAMGCGGKVTSVDGNESTASLGPADQDQLCLDTYTYVRNALSTDDIAELQCGFAPSQDPSTCGSTYATCVSNAKANAQQINWPLVPDCTGFNASVAKCNTTVDEYTKCLKEELDAVKSIEGDFPICSQAAQEAAGVAALSKISTDCLALMQTCQISFAPGISGSSSSSDGGALPDAN